MPVSTFSTPMPEGYLRAALKALRIAALVTALALPAAMALFWISLDVGSAPMIFPGSAALSLDPFARASGLALSMVPLGILVWGLIRLRAYIAGLLSGDVFSSTTSRALRDFALAIGLSALVKPFTAALLTVVLTWAAPPDQRMISFHISADIVLSVLFAGTIAVAAWTMQQAARLAEENDQFV